MVDKEPAQWACVHAGIFVPSLAVGGALGRLVGMLVNAALKSAGSSMQVSLPSYAVCHHMQAPSIPGCQG